MKDLYCYGPSIVAILAPNSLFSYSSGIFHGSVKQGDIHSSEDNKTYWEKTNHALVLVGWGVEKNTHTGEDNHYWLIKNSWGPTWGEDGYFKLLRGENNIACETMTVSIKAGPPRNSPLCH